MGYRPTTRMYNLAFEDFPGLEVRIGSVSLGELEEIEESGKTPGKQMLPFEKFIACAESWNVEHPKTGDPVPLTMEGLKSLEMEFVSALIRGWVTTIARASLPKGLSSNNGGKTGPSIPLSDGMTEEIMRQLEALQNPMPLPELNFTSD